MSYKFKHSSMQNNYNKQQQQQQQQTLTWYQLEIKRALDKNSTGCEV